MIKWVVLLVAMVIFGIIAGITNYLGPDDIRGCEEPGTGKCQKADAIVAVSGGDTNARTDEAIGLYQQGWAPLLIFSGAAQDTSGPSNAEAMRKRALNQGVPDSAILIEEFSRTTAENATNTSRFIADRQLSRILLVTSAYHQRRASLEFSAKLGPTVMIINHPVASDKQWNKWWWVTPRGWWLAGGELVKIIAYFAGSEEALS